MAPQRADDLQPSSLRSITFRLTSTPVQQLPQIVPHLAHQLVSCRQFLSAAQNAISKEHAALLHSFKTRLSSLLQDRTVEGRWTAVVLIKTTIELSGSEVLYGDKDKVSVWLRGLIGILNKPDPYTTKQLCIITLTRIFMLTREYPTLLRELTTPCLPSFVNACLNHFQSKELAQNSAQRVLLGPVLESIALLLPRHPAIFRPFEAQLRDIGLHVLSTDPFQTESKISAPSDLRTSAQKLLALLPACVPKGGSAEKLDGLIKDTVSYIHTAADQVFRAVDDDWESVAGVRSTLETQTLGDQPEQEATGANKHGGWVGIRSGAETIISHLGFLKHCITTPTTSAIPLRIGVFVDLLTRLMYMQVPGGKDAMSSRFNPQISRQEREELWAALPSIHIATIEVFVALVKRLKQASTPTCLQFLDLVPWLFEAERSDVSLRAAVYRAVAIVLPCVGSSLPKSVVSSLSSIIKSCCTDLLPVLKEESTSPSAVKQQNGNTNGTKSTANTEAMMNASTTISTSRTEYRGLDAASFDLLPILLSNLPAAHVSIPIRTEMDRVAVLTRHRDALTASVLNPSSHKVSVLPILATMAPNDLVTEGILRPRMPVIRIEGQDEELANEIGEINGFHRNGRQFESFGETLDTVQAQAFDWKSLDAPAPTPLDQATSSTVPSKSTGEAMSSSALSRGLDSRPSKRQQVEPEEEDEEEEEAPFSPTKRPRLDDEAFESTTIVREIVYETEISTVVAQATGAPADVESDSDDEDGSDFEIPALVMNVDGDTEDEDDEDEE